MLEWVCPDCGAKVNVLCLSTYPPIYQYKCSKCSYQYEEPENTQRPVAPIPKQYTLSQEDNATTSWNFR